MEEDGGALVGIGFMCEDGDVSVGMLAMDDLGAWHGGNPKSFRADGNTAIGSNFERRAHTPDVGPPGAAGSRTQGIIVFLLCLTRGVIWCAAEFAVDFPGVAVAAKCGQEGIGGFRGGDGFSREERGQPPCQYWC